MSESSRPRNVVKKVAKNRFSWCLLRIFSVVGTAPFVNEKLGEVKAVKNLEWDISIRINMKVYLK